MKKNAGKAPSFQFYPADWLKDPRLKRCSFNGKGVWIDVISHSFECLEKGVFRDENGPIPEQEILEMMGGNSREKKSGWDELKRRGIIKRDTDGAFYCKRLRQDWALHLKRKEAGKLGGNPNLLNNPGVDEEVNQNGNQNLTPSASASTSASASPSASPSASASPSRTRRRRSAGIQYTFEFNTWLDDFPKGDNRAVKSQTFKNWNRLLQEDDIDVETLIICKNNYKEEVRIKKTEPTYIIAPSNFLGRARKFEPYLPGTWTPPKDPNTNDDPYGKKEWENHDDEEEERHNQETIKRLDARRTKQG